MPMTQDQASAAFYRHIWPLRAAVLRTAGFLTRESNEAEDLAQETLLKAFRAIGQFDERTNPQAWVMAILRNTRIDRLRARRREAGQVSLDAEEMDVAARSAGEQPVDVHDPEALLSRFGDAEIIAELRALPEDIRWTLLLVEVEQLALAEAAEVLDVPVGTVKSRLVRGRQMLKLALTARAAATRR
jgi:RNA polymerase sigma-70 factor (ECF subfamily)